MELLLISGLICLFTSIVIGGFVIYICTSTNMFDNRIHEISEILPDNHNNNQNNLITNNHNNNYITDIQNNNFITDIQNNNFITDIQNNLIISYKSLYVYLLHPDNYITLGKLCFVINL
jgi:hypothetical protein